MSEGEKDGDAGKVERAVLFYDRGKCERKKGNMRVLRFSYRDKAVVHRSRDADMNELVKVKIIDCSSRQPECRLLQKMKFFEKLPYLSDHANCSSTHGYNRTSA